MNQRGRRLSRRKQGAQRYWYHCILLKQLFQQNTSEHGRNHHSPSYSAKKKVGIGEEPSQSHENQGKTIRDCCQYLTPHYSNRVKL
uniref:Uncharacterized protein n=1 Tax=Timema cristinae TaxID=61476 RepID=A0A7R9DH40_TIMCR|nr:unnamed protein product [Timema cristinae]